MIFSFVSYLIYTAMAFAAYGAIHGAPATRSPTRRSTAINCSTGAASSSASATAAWRPTSIPSSPRCSTRTKQNWLNRLHAGWPGGLVLGGLCTIALADNADWRISLGLILIPAFTFFFILDRKKFPKSEREQAGVSYLAMLKELRRVRRVRGIWSGVRAARTGFWLEQRLVWGLTGAVVLDFRRRHQIFWPAAARVSHHHHDAAGDDRTRHERLDHFADGTPMKAAGHNPAWVLVYTSAIMVVLRFCAGPLIHKFSPVGLLAGCSALAALGLFALSKTADSGMGPSLPPRRFLASASRFSGRRFSA
jgi:hypothetical protein